MSIQPDTWSDLLKKVKEGLGDYGPTPIVSELFRFLIKNRYEGVILIDTEGRIAFMDKPTEKSFGLPPGGAKGRMFSDFFQDLGLLEVAKTGVPQIGRILEIGGSRKIVTRLPIFKDGQLIGAVGRVVFREVEDIKNLFLRIEQLEAKVSGYKHDFMAKNRANYAFSDILGKSQSITETKERAMRISGTDCTVLLIGESGTGKELFAHSIHHFSKRSEGPFIRVNCAGIPFDLAESELFGYEKGAFTGSSKNGQKGKFELASRGTIFLDEISAMPLAIQAKLLRIIQDKEIQPLGCPETKKVDFRLIAATNMDLPRLVEKGSFRADLYYRLSAVPINVSALRERREDIALLARSLLPNINQRLSGTAQSISPQALELMSAYRWPGNVRELINALEQSVLNAYPNTEIEAKHLPIFLRTISPDQLPDEKHKEIRGAIADAERKAISLALAKTKGNKKRAAELLAISRAGLYQKLRRLDMI
ncbi:MAG: sigma 54-interacting transcriptional regulator [Syntrophorhabdales bacterium]|jgi:transcriptional regulator with PAS, ATPase and Fis domain